MQSLNHSRFLEDSNFNIHQKYLDILFIFYNIKSLPSFVCNFTTLEHESFQLIFLTFICPPTSHASRTTKTLKHTKSFNAYTKVFANCYNPILIAYPLTLTHVFATHTYSLIEATKTVLKKRVNKLILHNKMLLNNEWAKVYMYLNI